jgi:hypothetical protein
MEGYRQDANTTLWTEESDDEKFSKFGVGWQVGGARRLSECRAGDRAHDRQGAVKAPSLPQHATPSLSRDTASGERPFPDPQCPAKAGAPTPSPSGAAPPPPSGSQPMTGWRSESRPPGGARPPCSQRARHRRRHPGRQAQRDGRGGARDRELPHDPGPGLLSPLAGLAGRGAPTTGGPPS